MSAAGPEGESVGDGESVRLDNSRGSMEGKSQAERNRDGSGKNATGEERTRSLFDVSMIQTKINSACSGCPIFFKRSSHIRAPDLSTIPSICPNLIYQNEISPSPLNCCGFINLSTLRQMLSGLGQIP